MNSKDIPAMNRLFQTLIELLANADIELQDLQRKPKPSAKDKKRIEELGIHIPSLEKRLDMAERLLNQAHSSR